MPDNPEYDSTASVTEWAQEILDAPKLPTICEHCGKPFFPRNKNGVVARFCRPACHNAAKQARYTARKKAANVA